MKAIPTLFKLIATCGLACLGLLKIQAEGDTRLPHLFVAGDSTAAPGNGNTIVGWGAPLADFFDPDRVVVDNRARGGRSSRTFITEGHWDALLADLQEGDVVLIQFGHNDSGSINRERLGSDRPLRSRGSLPGLGDETIEIDNAVTGGTEVVATYGSYMRKMILDTREKGATPILFSLTARNLWKDGRIERGSGLYGYWTYLLAKELKVPFVDLSNQMADRLEAKGEEATKAFYPNDYVHTGLEGAKLHASEVVAGLKGLRPNFVDTWLSDEGNAIEADSLAWLKLPFPGDKSQPSLFMIGDSTVRNGGGDGSNGEWGWGAFMDRHFDANQMNLVNRAVGGLSSRTFYTGPYWPRAKAMMKPGDFLLIQFGHNDNIALNDEKRARGTIKGIGEESEAIDNMVTGKHEVVHTYGWYLRQYVREAKELGVTPIICSLVPRKKWGEDGMLQRSIDSYALWAQQVAEEEGVAFIDLHNRVADRYDELGPEAVDALFADAHTHTSREGAILNAICVAEGLDELTFAKE